MANKFEVGQKVKVVGSSRNNLKTELGELMGIKKGSSYTNCWVVQSPDFFEENETITGEKYKNTQFVAETDLELISSPQYTPITPKVGEKYRVVKEVDDGSGGVSQEKRPGDIVTITVADDGSHRCTLTDKGWFNRDELTTEYLELVEEPEPNCTFMGKPLFVTDEQVEKLSHGSIIRMGVDFGYEPQQINKPKKLTLMQALTKELKKLLSPRLQKFYKVEYIDRGLELTSTGRTVYINALFSNEGNHEKALTEMEDDADEIIKEADKE
jgi:hypothetical protein